MALIPIPGAADLIREDWTSKSASKKRLEDLQANINNNLTHYLQGLAPIQTVAKGKLQIMANVLKQAETGAITAVQLQGLMPSLKQAKDAVKQCSQDALQLDRDYFAAHADWRNGAFTGIPKPYFDTLGKIRTAQQNKVKEISGKATKVMEDYSIRASALSKQLFALSGQANDYLVVVKKAQSLVTKLDPLLRSGTTDATKAINGLGRIERDCGDKDKAKQKVVANSVSDVLKGENKLKANRKTVKEVHDAIVKMVAPYNFLLFRRSKEEMLTTAREALLSATEQCDRVKTAHQRADAAIRQAKAKVPGWPTACLVD